MSILGGFAPSKPHLHLFLLPSVALNLLRRMNPTVVFLLYTNLASRNRKWRSESKVGFKIGGRKRTLEESLSACLVQHSEGTLAFIR